MESETHYSETQNATDNQPDKCLPSDGTIKSQEDLPEEIVLKADFSCYCTICDCTLNRIKDALQHAAGKRHQKACKAKNETGNKNIKRTVPSENDDNAKKVKTDDESKDEDEAQKMLSKVFDETFHGGVVALSDNYYCKVCRCMIGNNRKNVNQHKEGKSHKTALEKFKQSLLSGTIGDDIPVEDPNQPFEGDGYVEKVKNSKRKTAYYCKICDFRTKEREVITEHMEEIKHQMNIRLAQEKEVMEQQRGYTRAPNENNQRFQHSGYHRGRAGERRKHQEGYYRESKRERSGQRRQFNESRFNRQESAFHGGYQNDINQDKWNCQFENFMPNQENRSYQRPLLDTPIDPSLLNQAVNPNPLMMPQIGVDQHVDSFFSHSSEDAVPFMSQPQLATMPFMSQPQQTPVPFMQQSQQTSFPFMPQQTPIPFMPQQTLFPSDSQLQQTPVPQSQQNILQTSLQKTETSEQQQSNNSAFGDMRGFITNENDAEVVIDVISSLLQTYLKYRLQALPGSFMKLLHKSPKNEEGATCINKLATGMTAKQIFINMQKSKKMESSFTPDDKRSSTSVLYERRSANKLSYQIENESSHCENVLNSPVDTKHYTNSYNTPKTSNEINDGYYRRSYIEDHIKNAIATRTMIGRQKDDNASRKATQIESSVDLFKQYRNFSGKEKASKNTRQSESFVADFSKSYTSSNNDNIAPRNARENKDSVNDLFMQYRNSNKGRFSQNYQTK